MARRSRGVRRRYAARQKVALPADQSNSRLMSLPAELRNRIWTAYFESVRFHFSAKECTRWPSAHLYIKAPPILETCKQVYSEALGIYYSSTTFQGELSEYGDNIRPVLRWLTNIGRSNARLINNIHLETMAAFYYPPSMKISQIYGMDQS
ncbi:Putative 2EXR domain-containing protein [Septoria linicola]|uniref:2EXR domain-containing protein n=1 Tax=Septoria linicola TaxID=215465 RepID=A0A9Q9EF53_9PEZI|nr:Putative 2EXR domain-containing protein [Septoria linicola]